LTSFVGRASEAGEVAGLLRHHRLVTVTGPGGVGKTRLAAEVARLVAARFADGVWPVALDSLREPGLVPSALATALGLCQRPSGPVAESLAEELAGRQLLLVLDNCEQVAPAVAELCARLLPAADDVRVLATSREPVGLAGEARYRLAPLAVARPGDVAATRSAAAALFTERARQMDAHFTVSPRSAPLIERVVRRLDGMPLAIELAAARVEALGLTELLDRLDDRFQLLVGADRTASARHSSLAAAVDWSYQLLSEHARRVFRRVAIFPGPFTLRAAESVAGPGAGHAVLDLVNCSLVAPPRPGPDGRPRYVLLETMRAFGIERLKEAGEQPAACAALAAHRAAQPRGAAIAVAAGFAALVVCADHGGQHGPGALTTLSARERELVALVAQGQTDAGIATELHISVRTVHSHLDRIRDKTGCRRRADLTRLALQANLG